jgi:hypothetical protein
MPMNLTRWGWRDYSVIRIINLNTRKDTCLIGKTKYFSPDISPDGKPFGGKYGQDRKKLSIF